MSSAVLATWYILCVLLCWCCSSDLADNRPHSPHIRQRIRKVAPTFSMLGIFPCGYFYGLLLIQFASLIKFICLCKGKSRLLKNNLSIKALLHTQSCYNLILCNSSFCCLWCNMFIFYIHFPDVYSLNLSILLHLTWYLWCL